MPLGLLLYVYSSPSALFAWEAGFFLATDQFNFGSEY